MPDGGLTGANVALLALGVRDLNILAPLLLLLMLLPASLLSPLKAVSGEGSAAALSVFGTRKLEADESPARCFEEGLVMEA